MNLIKKIGAFFMNAVNHVRNSAPVVAAVAFVFALMPSQAQAQIDVTDFTDALDDVGTALTASMGGVVTAALVVAGTIMVGLLLWRLFKRIAGK